MNKDNKSKSGNYRSWRFSPVGKPTIKSFKVVHTHCNMYKNEIFNKNIRYT